MIPAAYHMSKAADDNSLGDSSKAAILRILDTETEDTPSDGSKPGLLTISRGTALMLLLVYVAYLVFQVSRSSVIFIGRSY